MREQFEGWYASEPNKFEGEDHLAYLLNYHKITSGEHYDFLQYIRKVIKKLPSIPRVPQHDLEQIMFLIRRGVIVWDREKNTPPPLKPFPFRPVT